MFGSSSKMPYPSILSCLGQWRIFFINGGEGLKVSGGSCSSKSLFQELFGSFGRKEIEEFFKIKTSVCG